MGIYYEVGEFGEVTTAARYVSNTTTSGSLSTPRLTSAQISALPSISRVVGEEVFDTTNKLLKCWDGTSFVPVVFSTDYLLVAGGTMTGSLTLNADPTMPLQAATKNYVDSFSSGLHPKANVRVATTANLNATYANGSGGIGATLTNSGTLAALSIDGVSLVLNDRVLVKDQTVDFQNGIYVVTTVGDGSTAWVLTRSTDYDESSEIQNGDFTISTEGTVNVGITWLQTTTGTIIVGTTAIQFVEFGLTRNLVPGFGIDIMANVISVIPSTFLQPSNNLSDVSNTATSRTNLGLGSMSVQDSTSVSITGGTISNSATTATSANTINTIVLRDGSGNFSAGTITASLNGNASTSTSATNFTGSLSGDVTGTQSATVIGTNVVSNSKLSQMPANTFKANNTGSTANALDITVAQAQALLGSGSSTPLTATEIGFGSASNTLTGNVHLTYDSSSNVVTHNGSNPSLNFGVDLYSKKLAIYDGGAGNDFQFHGLGVLTAQLLYTVAETTSDHVFYAATSVSARNTLAKIRGNGAVVIGGGNEGNNLLFDIATTTKASRPIPSMTTTQRNAISSPVTDAQVFDTTLGQGMFWNGSAWAIMY